MAKLQAVIIDGKKSQKRCLRISSLRLTIDNKRKVFYRIIRKI